MKFSTRVGDGPTNKLLNFGIDPVHHLDTGIVYRIRQYWEIRKVVILIRQMAALVRRALAEVCTVPVLLVYFLISACFRAIAYTTLDRLPADFLYNS